MFADDDTRNLIKQACARAHDAGAESAYQGKLVPIRSASGISEAYNFSMGRRIAGLHPEIVSPGDNVAGGIGQHRADGNSPGRGTKPGLQDRFV